MYASVQDLIDRYGETELVRLTTPDGADMDGIDTDRVEGALREACALVDTYLRKRYNVPLDIAPPEIRRATCVLTRYDLMHGDQREPTEQARLARKEVVDWLSDIAAGKVQLDLEEVAPGEDSYSQASTRRAPLSDDATVTGASWGGGAAW